MKFLWSKFIDPIKGALFRGDRFSRGVITILTGTTISKVIAFAAIPLLSRLFSPADFGVLALFTMFSGLLSTLVTWRYESAIVLPEEDEKAANLLGVCFGLTTFCALAIGAVFYLYGNRIVGLFGAPELLIWLYWCPLAIWATGIFTSLRLWNSRTDDFRAISIARVTDTSALVITQVGLGAIMRGTLTGLMLGPFVARLSGAGILLWNTARKDGRLILQSLSFRTALEQAKRYVRFPLYDLPASTLSSLTREIPPGVLGIFFVTQWVGFYSIAIRILSVPIQMLGGAIAQVYLPVARDAQEAGKLDRLSLSIFDRLTGIAMTPMIVLAIAAPQLVGIILGERWITAGEMLQWLAPSLMMGFIASPLSEVYSVLERQPEKLVFNVALFFTGMISLVIGGFLGDAILAVALYSVSVTVFWTIQCYWLLRLSQIPTGVILTHFGSELLRAAPFILFIALIQYRYNSPKKLLLASFIAMAVFIVWRWKEFLGPGKAGRKALFPIG